MTKHLRLAIVGAGPAGIYAADLLHKAEADVHAEIDVFERLPAPYGLVRYGVAPDHPRIKGVVSALREVLEAGGVRLFGNVHVGRDLTLADLRRHYHAVIIATGADRDAAMDLAGADARGVFGAADFVSWFDGHPDAARTWDLSAASVGVIGNGNVALDVARMLAKFPDDLMPTEIPENVEAGLRASAVTDVHVFGRRGPLDVKFTPLELRELGEVPGVDIVLDERDFGLTDAPSVGTTTPPKQALVLGRIMQSWLDAQREQQHHEPHDENVERSARRIHLHFWSRPVEVLTEVDADGAPAIVGLRIERMAPGENATVSGTGEYEDIALQSLYRAVGYYGTEVAEIPFDERAGVVPNDRGRVLDVHGTPIPGLYTTGWIKRGPVGLIGATKSDAKETLASLLEDADSWWQPEQPDASVIPELLAQRGVPFTTIEGWRALDAHEIALGEDAGRPRIKVVDRDEMTRVSRGE